MSLHKPNHNTKLIEQRFYTYHGDLKEPKLGLLMLNGRAYLPADIFKLCSFGSMDFWSVIETLANNREKMAAALGVSLVIFSDQLAAVKEELLQAGAQKPSRNFTERLGKK